MAELGDIRERLTSLERWRGEIERHLGRQNGLRSGLEKDVQELRDEICDMRHWLDEKLSEVRREQAELRKKIDDVFQSINTRLGQLERPLWTTVGRVAILGAVVLSIISILMKVL